MKNDWYKKNVMGENFELSPPSQPTADVPTRVIICAHPTPTRAFTQGPIK